MIVFVRCNGIKDAKDLYHSLRPGMLLSYPLPRSSMYRGDITATNEVLAVLGVVDVAGGAKYFPNNRARYYVKVDVDHPEDDTLIFKFPKGSDLTQLDSPIYK